MLFVCRVNFEFLYLPYQVVVMITLNSLVKSSLVFVLVNGNP